LSFQHWKDVSPLAKDFIDKLLVLDVSQRMTSPQALKHPWVTTMAASSSNKNLHRTISKNLLERQSTRNSVKSAKSTKSTKSNRSNKSLRSEHRRVMPEEIDELHRDPEVQAELSSISGY
jgi:protein serine kinase H